MGMADLNSRPKRWYQLGVPVDALDLRGATAFVGHMLDRGLGGWVATPNPEIIYAAWRSPGLAGALAKASLALPEPL